ncbi:MAG: hypothetical protein PHU12_02140 [Candidatus Aenigmarchaeota archaeon]|nr:hypothetical protein [Candidatus Aenigmarchaeota archaeon]
MSNDYLQKHLKEARTACGNRQCGTAIDAIEQAENEIKKQKEFGKTTIDTNAEESIKLMKQYCQRMEGTSERCAEACRTLYTLTRKGVS